MAAEVQEWVEGGEAVKKVTSQKEPLVGEAASSEKACGGSSSTATNGSVESGEPALSVISDTLSEEYSSDSGKGGSDTTVTPPDSVNGGVDALLQEGADVPWPIYQGYTPYTAYSKSLGSAMPNHAMIYEFEIPQTIVGRLIGRYGSYVNKIKYATGANIIVKRHSQTKLTKICAIEGVCAEIEQAIQMIRERFPVKRYPELTLEQVNLHQVIPASNISFIPNNRLNLIEGVVNDVCISCIVDLDHIFVQQPTHPTYPALTRLHDALKGLYEQPKGAPLMVRPFNPGVICVTKIGTEDWVRCEVVAIQEEKDQVTARLVDVGGYVQVPIEVLRQIRVDFVTIPFQATECRLANIAPVNETEGWSEEAFNFFKIICQGQVLQAHVVGYCNSTGATLINLYKLTGSSNHILINEEMVTHNYAKWIDEIDQQYFYPDSVAAYSSEIDQLSHNLGEWALSPDLMTVIPTELYNNANATSDTATTAPVPEETDETQPCQDAEVPSTSSSAKDNAITTSSSTAEEKVSEDVVAAAANTSTLSWADEMCNEDLLANDLTENVKMTATSSTTASTSKTTTAPTTVKGKDKNSRRKKKKH